MNTLTILAIHLFGFSLLFAILTIIFPRKIWRTLFYIIFTAFIINLILLIIFVPKKHITKIEKPLTELIFENDSIKTITIYKESSIFDSKALYSVDFNKVVSYDSLTLDSLRMAVICFPKSLYNTKKE